jgi:transcriptional regulator with XRE-family HTH domain
MDISKVTPQAPPRVEVRVWMARTGRRASDVAREIGVSRAAMSEYLKARYDLGLVAIDGLAHISGIPPERLVTDPKTSAALKRLRTIPKLTRATRAKKVRNG